jgi:hypothetical protein
MRYYHIDNGAIASGPHATSSAYIKRLTRCGQPEKLDLAAFGLLPEVRDALDENQRYGEPVVEAEQVRIPAVDKTADELAAELQAQREATSVTALQGELQLLVTPDPTGQFANAYEAVLAWADTQDAATKAFFRRQPTWHRTSPIIAAGAAVFGWTDADLDNLFAAAGTI